MKDRDRELAEATAELSETLEELRGELEGPPEGPLGLPRPPKPSELLRFTERYTIPATVALLEAAIRSLELLGAALRVADSRPVGAVEDVRSQMPADGRDRLAATSRETLRRLDDALAELQSAARGDPSDPDLRGLFEEARALRAEVDDRLAEAIEEPTPRSERGRADRGVDAGRDGPDPDAAGIDVDEELASIKRTADQDPDGEDDSAADADTGENPPASPSSTSPSSGDPDEGT